MLLSEPSQSGVADDAAFASAIAQTPGFVAAGVFSAEQGLQPKIPADLALGTPTVNGLSDWSQTCVGLSLSAPFASLPIPEIATSHADRQRIRLVFA